MKHFRLTLSIIMLALILILFSFGVYAILRPNTGIANNTDFISGDENVFVSVDCLYNGPTLTTADATPTKSYVINQTDPDSYKDGPITLDSWKLGRTDFTSTQTVISLTFTIKNLNTKNSLNVSMTNLAYDFNQRFTTTYKQAPSVEELEQAGASDCESTSASAVCQVPTINILPGQSCCIKLIYELKNFSSSFSLENNVQVLFESSL